MSLRYENMVCPHCNYDNGGNSAGQCIKFPSSLHKEFSICTYCNKTFNHFYSHEFWILPKSDLHIFQTLFTFKGDIV